MNRKIRLGDRNSFESTLDMKQFLSEESGDMRTNLLMTSNKKNDRKLNATEVLFMLVKFQVGPFLLSYPLFYSQAGLIGGFVGFILG